MFKTAHVLEIRFIFVQNVIFVKLALVVELNICYLSRFIIISCYIKLLNVSSSRHEQNIELLMFAKKFDTGNVKKLRKIQYYTE